MKKLDEKLSLLRMAQAFGVDPDPKLVKEIQQLQEQQDRLRQRVHAAGQALFETKPAEYKRPSTYPDGKHIPAQLPDLYQPANNTDVPKNQRCDNCEYYVVKTKKCTRWNNAVVRPAYWCAKWDAVKTKSEELIQAVPAVPETNVDRVVRSLAESTLVNPEPVLVSKPTDPLEFKVKQLEAWISRIAATGPGGGAGQIYNLDIPVKTVTGDYTIGRRDYYIGVSSSVKTYITLPGLGSNQKEGRIVVIKDESGHAQLTPIAIVGTIDNDPNGAEIRINNGAVQLVYRSGWRII